MRNLNDLNILLRCEQVQIIDDNAPGSNTPPAVEEDEFFDVTLFSSDSIDLVGGNTRVIITDNDGKAEPDLASTWTTLCAA